MTRFPAYLAAFAAIGTVAVPATAQYPQSYPQTYPQPYPQTYPQAYPQTYPQQAYPGYAQPYGYNQGYGQNAVGSVIDQLLGNRYNVTDRQAVSRCASAAMAEAAAQYAHGYNRGYTGQGYNQGIAAPAMHVTAITDVQRRTNGLRVKGLLASGYSGVYGNQYGYQNRNYAQGDVNFRCNVDYRGAVTNVRLGRNEARRY